MPQNIRLNDILDLARRQGKVTTDSLAASFGVTVQTARRDLNALCQAGHLVRVYGGAVLPSSTRNIDRDERTGLQSEGKARMASAVAARIPDGASVFLDIGTTLEAVARCLTGHRNLMVVTNNLHAGNALADAPGVDLILTGGLLRSSDGGLVGETTAEFVRQFRPDYALIGASALSPDGDALDYDFREVRVAQTVIGLARASWLMADHTKFARSAPVRIGRIASFDAFVTDAPPPEDLAETCRGEGCEIVITG
ncbi:MAG: DeoR/GlpR transcriptional regulator [Silicimonas sp.]|nr:DeoR/GlpR transcriptional regulator [Silicimonas sp.]